MSAPTIHLAPAPIPPEGTQAWRASGRATGAALSPAGCEVAVYVRPSAASLAAREGGKGKGKGKGGDGEVYPQDRAVYFGRWAVVDRAVDELFTASHTIFTNLQELHLSYLPLHLSSLAASALAPAQPLSISQLGTGSSAPPNLASAFAQPGPYVSANKAVRPSERQVGNVAVVVRAYVDRVDEVWKNDDLEPSVRSHHHAISSILNLALLLYLPAPGQSGAIIGEQLLRWLNASHPSALLTPALVTPVTALARPWEADDYWPIVLRSVLRGQFGVAAALLGTLAAHPQRAVGAFAGILARQLELVPRSTNPVYALENQFLHAHVGCRNALSAQVQAFARGRPRGEWFEFDADAAEGTPADEGDEREMLREYEEYLVRVADMLGGDEGVVLGECEDWREAVGAYGVLVEVQLRRDDVPALMERILEEKPADSTIVSDSIQLALLQADVTKAVMGCNDFDLWLAAHLTDVLDKLGMIEDDEDDFELPLRDHLIFAYTDTLQANPAYWRIACDYLRTCGEPGIGRMRTLLLRTPLDPGEEEDEGEGDDGGMQVEEEAAATRRRDKGKGKERMVERINEVLEVCTRNRLEGDLREVCRNAAPRLARNGDFGEALAYAARSGSGSLMVGLADEVLDVYIDEGLEPFCDAVSAIPTRLIEGWTDLSADQSALSPPALPNIPRVARIRLQFLVKMREFLLIAQSGDGPRAAEHLALLFSSGVVPPAAWAVLLLDSVRYLQDPDTLLTAKETFEILRHVEEIGSAAEYAPEAYFSLLRRLTERGQAGGENKTDETNVRAAQADAQADEWKGERAALDVVRIAALDNLARTGMDLVQGWA